MNKGVDFGRIMKGLSAEDAVAIDGIARRAETLAKRVGREVKPITLFMDLIATHDACPLRLGDLLAAPDTDFAHDVFGIMRHIDRETGHLGDCFLPRYAAL